MEQLKVEHGTLLPLSLTCIVVCQWLQVPRKKNKCSEYCKLIRFQSTTSSIENINHYIAHGPSVFAWGCTCTMFREISRLDRIITWSNNSLFWSYETHQLDFQWFIVEHEQAFTASDCVCWL